MANKVIVTGADGFIGRVVCEMLKVPNECRYDIANDPWGEDVTKEDVINEIALGAHTIVHLAATTGIAECEKEPQKTRRLNVESAIELGREAKRLGASRFIFASSSAVYGEASRYIIDESHPLTPRSLYGKTKLEAEKGLLALADENFRVVCLRKSNVYGQGLSWKGGTVLDNFIDKYLKREPMKLSGSGMQRRDFVHVMDVARIYSQIAIRPQVRSGAYNVGGPETVSIRGLAEMVNKVGESVLSYRVPIETMDAPEGVGWHDFVYECSKARMEFGHVPGFTLDYYVRERCMQRIREGAKCG